MKKQTLLILVTLLFQVLFSQPTVGLLQYGNNDLPGYVLLAPASSTKSFLIDKCGYKVHEWNSNYVPGQMTHLLPDGSLMRSGRVPTNPFSAGGGGTGGIIERISWNDSVIWSYNLCSTNETQHHDIKPLPNGNVLAMVWEKRTSNQAIARGRDPNLVNATLFTEKIVEIQPTGPNSGTVVWQWTNWDHLVQDFDSTKLNYGVVPDHPELFNFNYLNGNVAQDWMHFNGIDYDPIKDLIVVSSRKMCEIYVIDHSTTTAQATGHTGGNYGRGGDVLYRWGNPMAYNRGTLADRQFFYQHCPTFIPPGYPHSGKIMVFNNGVNRPAGAFSTIDVIQPPLDTVGNFVINQSQPFGPANLYWTYSDPTPTNFFSGLISGVYKMYNGNVFITSGQTGLIFEVDSLGNKLWTYQNPITANGPLTQGDTAITTTGGFKSVFYPLNYSAFVGQNLIPQGPLELNPIAYNCSMTLNSEYLSKNERLKIFPNPVREVVNIEGPSDKKLFFSINEITGRIICEGDFTSRLEFPVAELSSGIYFIKFKGENTDEVIRFIKE